ncbi:MAG: carbohydrate binding domain-containing protein [candidate division KSB1 bacterium]|nr:carbohydrate binding domain-containing protein [candidate division KSB1 bacterium]MDZ7302375.1 carbohydrate binding domain-containing protein [candidate division KSB1 bacterium]
MLSRQLIFGCLMLGLATTLYSQNFEGGFNFYLPPQDFTSQRFLPSFPAQPITAQDFVSIHADGHFIVQNRPLRFFGINFVADGAFPTKSKAWFIAGRLRKFGFNLVRFHHLDNPWSRESLFEWGKDTRHLNPVTLDRLENLIAELKKNGIYIDMNLHVSRTFNAKDGVPNADSLADYGKGVTYFDPQLIALQKEYAQQLLTHVNPYTGLALVNDPVMAMVEITNENSLYRMWRDGALKPYAQGGILIARHHQLLNDLWHSFLRKKYFTTDSLRAAWNRGARDPGGTNQIRNGTFEGAPPSSAWILELHNTASATMTLSPENPHSGQFCAKIVVSRVTGTDWHIQWKQIGLSIAKDSLYTVTFAGRADSTRRFSLSVMRDNSPWTSYSWQSLLLTPQWQTFAISFRAAETVTNQIRLSFTLGAQKGTYWFDDITFAEAGIKGLLADESLESVTVRRIDYAECPSFTDQRVQDISAFYITLQNDFFADMVSYLKNHLGVKVPIVGTNWNVGPADLAVQSRLDYLDNHAYWDHPQFPNQPWSPTDWLINNTPMVKATDGGTIAGLMAGVAALNKPYTISEYNHAFPNRYQTEALLFLTAYASFHDVDGLMFFDYNGSVDDWETDKVNGYFNLNRNSAMMALMPSCAYAYRQGMIAKAKHTLRIAYAPRDYLLLPKYDTGGWSGPILFPRKLALQHAIRTETFDSATPMNFSTFPAEPVNPYLSDTREIIWDTQGLLSVATPQFIGATGFLQNFVNQKIGNLTLKNASDFGTLTWIALNGDSLHNAESSLLTLSSKLQNSGMVWDGTRTVHDRWGQAPTLIYPLRVTLQLFIHADSLRLYPLDNWGRETMGPVTYGPVQPNLFEITLDQHQTRTLWFGLEKIGEGVPTRVLENEESPPREFLLEPSYPNPFGSAATSSAMGARNTVTHIRFAIAAAGWVSLKVYDLQGREVVTLVNENLQPGRYERTLEVDKLHTSGVYFYRLQVMPRHSGASEHKERFVQTGKLVLLQ